jgi:subtilisin family serine protease
VAIISSLGTVGNFPPLGYGQTLDTETTNSGIAGNTTQTNMTNANVSEAVIPQAGDILSDRYIIVLRENATLTPQIANETASALSEDLTNLGVNVTAAPEVGQVFVDLNQTLAEGGQPSLAGGDVTTQDVLESIQNNPNVAYVEPDSIVTYQAQVTPTGVDRSGADKSSTMAGDGQGNVSGVTVAIIDTGIDLDHPDLNVIMDQTFVAGTPSGDDDEGHGTHVAGIVAAKDDSEGVVGVAPGANLIALKVLDSTGSGSLSSIIRAIDWVAANADLVDVVNMSLGGRHSQAELDAIDRATDRGVIFVVAAGNEHIDAINTSPANSPDAITVSAIADSDGRCGAAGPATTRGADDSFATYSNFGRVIDIAAPGTNILSTLPDGQFGRLTGTSMASPHVAGAAAVWVSEIRELGEDPLPDQVKSALIGTAIRDAPVAQCLEDRGYISTQDDRDRFREPLLFVTALAPPPSQAASTVATSVSTTVPASTVQQTTQPQRYVLEATDTRNPTSEFTLEVDTLGQLQTEINRLVQGGYSDSGNVTTTAADLSLNNNTALANNVDQAIDSIANMEQQITSQGTEGTLANTVDGNFCFNISWFKICVSIEG